MNGVKVMGAVKSVGTSRDGARFAVEAFGSAVRKTGRDVGDDSFCVFPDRDGDALEWLEARTSGPSDPLVELDAREPLVSAVENADQGILEQVGAIQALVVPLQQREPVRVEQRQVPEALEQRPARGLELLAFLHRSCGANFVSTDLVDRVLCEPLDMEPVEDQLGLRGALGHAIYDALCPIPSPTKPGGEPSNHHRADALRLYLIKAAGEST